MTFHLAQATADQEATRKILTTSFVLFSALGVLAGLVLFVGAHPIASVSFRNADRVRDAEEVLPFLGFAACCQFLRHWVMAAESGLQRYDLQAWAEGVGSAALYGGLVLAATLGLGIVVLAAWWGLASLGTLFGHWYLWRTRTGVTARITRGWDSAQARALVGFGVRQWASQLGGNLFGHLDRVVVNLLLGQSAAGIYSAGTSVAVRINELSAAPVQVVGPAIAAAPTITRRAGIYRRAQALNAVVAFGLAAVVMLASEPLARLLVPAEVDTMASVLRIMGLCYGIYSTNAVAFFAAQGLGRPSINARWMAGAGCVFVVALLPLSRLFGIRGAAWGNLAFALTLGINFDVLRSLGVRSVPTLLTGTKFVISLAACFLISSAALPSTDDVLAQVLLGLSTLTMTGGWVLLRLLRVTDVAWRGGGLLA